MAEENPIWPPSEYDTDIWPVPWLRYETEFPGSGRPSRLASHSFVPFVATLDQPSDAQELQAGLKRIAGNYLHRLSAFIDALTGAPGLALPTGWLDALAADMVDNPDPDPLAWLDVWPPVGADTPGSPPRLASWNLSRQSNFVLPATVIMVASEIYIEDQGVASFSFGVRVPMSVRSLNGTVQVIIRSMTAEYPRVGTASFTEMFAGADGAQHTALEKIQSNILNVVSSEAYRSDFADAAYVDAATVVHDEFAVRFDDPVNFAGAPFTVTYWSKAAAASDATRTVRPKFPEPENFSVVSTYRFDDRGTNETLINSTTCPLVTHAAGPGEADVFVQTPPGWFDPQDPAQAYNWTMRRPERNDTVLDRYRTVRNIGAANNFELRDAGFQVRLCPDYVPEDVAPSQAGETIKKVELPGGETPQPRRNDYSALMAYCHSQDFFDLLGHFGLDPAVFVVRAKKDIGIFYRYGIFPGPRRDGKTINAQVAYRCDTGNLGEKPTIKMQLALANLNRWSRPEKADGTFGLPEPLGIATSVRWMLHEFCHFLLAARLGQLELDFAHSAGDAMAAVYADPYSRLADMRGDMPEQFRGFTYPFVFAPRRHDRSPLLGWAWYGTLNRSVIEAPPSGCDDYKSYLTEQILSSSVFRLYRTLGGDTVSGDAPDRYIRHRASFMTLFLLIRAMIGFAQSPSKAEMLELGLEEVGLLMLDPLVVPPMISAPPPPQDEWAGGVTHKVVRWAFETQGMFPQDVLQITNAPGRAPPVDIYVRDQRPLEVPDVAGRTVYGAGSYAPVSLDWDGDRLWTVSANGPFQIGNRGHLPSGAIFARLWIGVLQADTSVSRWDLTVDGIVWTGSIALGAIQSRGPQQEGELRLPDLTKPVDTARNIAFGPILLLLEVSCALDRANSDPNTFLPSAIAAGATPPTVPRAVTDLVANDNNLGLMIL